MAEWAIVSLTRALSILDALNPIALVGLVREITLRESSSWLAIYDSLRSRGYSAFRPNGVSTPLVHDDLALLRWLCLVWAQD